MFVCNSTIAGFKGVIGPLSTHIGMLIAMFWVPRLPQNDKYHLSNFWYMCFFLHIFLIIVSLVNLYINRVTHLLSQVLTIAGMSLYIAVYLQLTMNITYYWDDYTQNDDALTTDEEVAVNWYFIEIFMLMGFILSYMLIIFVRFFFKVRFNVSDPERCYEVNTDFIEVEATAFQFYITIAAPLFVTFAQLQLNDNFDLIEETGYDTMLSCQMWLQGIQILAFMFIIFADLRSGSPFKKKCFVKSQLGCGVIAMYLIPIIQWIIILTNLDIVGVWSICIGSTALALMIHASLLITPTLIAVYFASQSPENIDGFKDRQIIPYKQIFRNEGDGEIRIGKRLELREDMYALTLVSYLIDEKLDEALEFEEQKNVKSDNIGVATPKADEDDDDRYSNADNDEIDRKSVSMSRKAQDNKYINKRSKNASTAFMIWSFQSVIAFLLLGDVLAQQELFACIVNLRSNYVRFVCAMMLHLQLQDELKQGLQIMKFTNNHPEQFHNWWIPFILGFMQTQMVTIIELVNLINICANNNIMDIVMNYVALAVVADFDDYIFEAVSRGDQYPELLESEAILEIEHTTSSQCRHEEDFELQLKFKQRNLSGQVARIIYLMCRLIYITIYFYFFEFLTLILIFTFPITFASLRQESEEAGNCGEPIYPPVNQPAPPTV